MVVNFLFSSSSYFLLIIVEKACNRDHCSFFSLGPLSFLLQAFLVKMTKDFQEGVSTESLETLERFYDDTHQCVITDPLDLREKASYWVDYADELDAELDSILSEQDALRKVTVDLVSVK